MEDEENVKEFPGLYHEDGTAYESGSDCDSSSEKSNRKELTKPKKEKNRDIGYAALGTESSEEDMDIFDAKNSVKSKKSKSFKFLKKKDKDSEKEKRKEDKDRKKEREVKKREKEEKRKSKKDKKKKHSIGTEGSLPIFGVPLSLAVERCPSHDGIRLPVIVRCCIDFIEEYGLSCEGIYRVGGPKSKVQSLRRAFDIGEIVRLDDQQPHVVASLLKHFLRELPETVLTVGMMPHFEDVSLIPNPKERAEALRQLIDRLPSPNQCLLQYMLKHMGHVVDHVKETKMSYQNVCVVLSPSMQISHRVLNVMFHSHRYLFGCVHIKKYIPPITSSQNYVDQLNAPNLIEEELNKQESLLASLHCAVAAGHVSHKTEEQLWEAQRIHTLLKRRLKMTEKKESDSSGGGRDSSSLEKINYENVSSDDHQCRSKKNSEDHRFRSEKNPQNQQFRSEKNADDHQFRSEKNADDHQCQSEKTHEDHHCRSDKNTEDHQCRSEKSSVDHQSDLTQIETNIPVVPPMQHFTQTHKVKDEAGTDQSVINHPHTDQSDIIHPHKERNEVQGVKSQPHKLKIDGTDQSETSQPHRFRNEVTGQSEVPMTQLHNLDKNEGTSQSEFNQPLREMNEVVGKGQSEIPQPYKENSDDQAITIQPHRLRNEDIGQSLIFQPHRTKSESNSPSISIQPQGSKKDGTGQPFVIDETNKNEDVFDDPKTFIKEHTTSTPIIPILPKPISVRAIRNRIALNNSKKVAKSNLKDNKTTIHQHHVVHAPVPIYATTNVVTTDTKSATAMSNVTNSLANTTHTTSTTNELATISSSFSKKTEEFDLEVLRKEDLRLSYEHEELLATQQQMEKRLKCEKNAIARLKDEIQEMQTIYGYRTHSYDSSESEGSDSEGGSDTEEEISNQISVIDKVNREFQVENLSLISKIQEERDAVIRLRVCLRQSAKDSQIS